MLNFTVSVAAGNVLPAASYVSGSGVWSGTVGQLSNITVSPEPVCQLRGI